MKVSELIMKLKAFNPEAEVWQIYDGMAKPVVLTSADKGDLEEINHYRKKVDSDNKPLDHAVVFWAG